MNEEERRREYQRRYREKNRKKIRRYMVKYRQRYYVKAKGRKAKEKLRLYNQNVEAWDTIFEMVRYAIKNRIWRK